LGTASWANCARQRCGLAHDPAVGHYAPELLVIASDRASYGRLCRLLSVGKRRAPKSECLLGLFDAFHTALCQ